MARLTLTLFTQDRRLILGDVDEESGIPPHFYYAPFGGGGGDPGHDSAEAPCPDCKTGSTKRAMSTRWKLLFLLFVASLSLLSIVLISEQLIVRHLERATEEEVDLTTGSRELKLTLEDWAEREAGSDRLHFQRHHSAETEPPLLLPRPVEIVEDGVFWSSSLEAKVAPGPSDQAVQDQIRALRTRPVGHLREPDWLHCGRAKNRFVEFAGGNGHACARNRDTHPEYVQGEVMAFYLARMLGISNTPAVALSKVRERMICIRSVDAFFAASFSRQPPTSFSSTCLVYRTVYVCMVNWGKQWLAVGRSLVSASKAASLFSTHGKRGLI